MKQLFTLIAVSWLAMYSFAQNVGIGTPSPTGPLSFGAVEGPLLWLDHNAMITRLGNEVFFDTRGPDGGSAHIVFGYGHTGAFVPRMRITGDGLVGMGLTDPAYRVDVVGRIRARNPAGAKGLPGIAFDDVAGTTRYAEMVTSGNNIGFRYNNVYAMQYNPVSAAMAFNNSFGAAGMVLVSGGANSVAEWKTPAYGKIYNNAVQQFEGIAYTLNTNGTATIMNGLTVNLNMATTSKLAIDYSITAFSPFCFTCAATAFKIELLAGGAVVSTSLHSIINGFGNTITGHSANIANAGVPQSIQVRVTKISGPDLQLPNTAGQLSGITVIPFPAN